MCCQNQNKLRSNLIGCLTRSVVRPTRTGPLDIYGVRGVVQGGPAKISTTYFSF